MFCWCMFRCDLEQNACVLHQGGEHEHDAGDHPGLHRRQALCLNKITLDEKVHFLTNCLFINSFEWGRPFPAAHTSNSAKYTPGSTWKLFGNLGFVLKTTQNVDETSQFYRRGRLPIPHLERPIVSWVKRMNASLKCLLAWYFQKLFLLNTRNTLLFPDLPKQAHVNYQTEILYI